MVQARGMPGNTKKKPRGYAPLYRGKATRANAPACRCKGMLDRAPADQDYSTNWVKGLGATTGGRRNVQARLTAKSVTAVISTMAETGRSFQAQAAKF